MSKRPATVTTLMWMVLCLTAWDAIRLGASIADWDLLAEFAPRPGPFYISASAAFWTLGWLALWTMLHRRSPRARLSASIFFSGYAIWWWADRIFLQAPRSNAPFAAIATIILLAIVAVLLYHPRTRAYLPSRETHEQTPTDQHPA